MFKGISRTWIIIQESIFREQSMVPFVCLIEEMDNICELGASVEWKMGERTILCMFLVICFM